MKRKKQKEIIDEVVTNAVTVALLYLRIDIVSLIDAVSFSFCSGCYFLG
jgi:hypothetical protein